MVYSWPALDTEWTGLYAAINWMKIQLGTWQPAKEELKAFEDRHKAAQHAQAVAQATGEEADIVQKEKTVAEMRNKSKTHFGSCRPGLVGQDDPNLWKGHLSLHMHSA